MEFNQELFSKVLKETRRERMGKEEFAEKLNKSERTISRMESGASLTTIPTLIDICKVLDVSPNHLLSANIRLENLKTDPTTYEQLINLLSVMDSKEIALVLNILKTVYDYKK